MAAFFGGKVPAATEAGADVAGELGGQLVAKLGEYVEAMEKIKIKDGIRIAMAVSAAGNKFFQVRVCVGVWVCGCGCGCGCMGRWGAMHLTVPAAIWICMLCAVV